MRVPRFLEKKVATALFSLFSPSRQSTLVCPPSSKTAAAAAASDSPTLPPSPQTMPPTHSNFPYHCTRAEEENKRKGSLSVRVVGMKAPPDAALLCCPPPPLSNPEKNVTSGGGGGGGGQGVGVRSFTGRSENTFGFSPK